jgi:N-acetylglucosamine-6-phosphate deacetylase
VAELVLTGGAVLREGAWVPGEVVCRDGVVVADGPGAGAEVRDVTGLLVAPGLIDLQCNGALGIDVTRAPERLWELAAALPRWGVTAWLPTVVTAPVGAIDAALAALNAVPAAGAAGAVPLGLHLEGPYLAPAARGAHPDALLRSPSLAEVAGWSREAGVAVVTVAPELPGALEMIEALAGRGIVVSLGHSAATVEQATAGIDAGATWVTHLFNGMPPFHHRSPGLPGVAMADARVRVGVIADGVHVAPTAVAVAQRALGPRLVLVTDAVSPMGLPSEAPGSGVRLADGTLAGCDTPLDQAVRQLAAFSGCPTAEAVHAATAAPAAVLGDATRGHLEPGARADLVVLTEDLHLVSTYVGGELVHDARWSRG